MIACPIAISWVEVHQLPHVRRLEELAYGWSSGSPDDLWRMLEGRGTALLVATRGADVVGYLIYHLDARRRQVAILDLAVHPTWRRRGVARGLVGFLLDRTDGLPLDVVAAIEETLLPAQLLLRQLSFRCEGILRDRNTDADIYFFRHRPRSSS